MSNDLLGKIAEIDKDVADNLKEGGLTNEDVKELCYDALKEIIPGDGMKLILLRSRIRKVISQETEKAPTDKSHPTTKALVEKRKIDMAVCVDNHIDLSEDDTFSSSSTDDKGLTKAGPSTKRAKPTPATPPATFQVKSPVFTIYRDRRVDLAVESGSIPEHLVHDIVRGTVSNMISMTLCDPWNRLPTTMELKEMAKSLVVTYPLLSDPVNGHERLFNRLKKRMYNKKTVENKRGPNKKKASNKITSYIKTTECPEDQQSNDVDPIMTDISTGEQQSNAEAGSSNSSESSVSGMDDMIMGRLYNSLSKEMQKSKPSPNVINSYLNQEFKSRRARIKKMPATERCSRLFELYPCFKNPVEIIEEVRRINEKAVNNDPKKFMNECVMRLEEELDVMLYFGCSKQRMELPKKPGKVSKVVQLMKNLHLLFGNGKLNKSAKKLIELIYVIKDHEDLETVCSRRQGKGIPLLCLDKTSAYLVCQGTLIFTVELRNIMQAVLALIGLFYLIDVDYPKSHELGLTMLHSLLFHDMNTPADLYNSFESAKEDYLKFKQNSSDDF